MLRSTMHKTTLLVTLSLLLLGVGSIASKAEDMLLQALELPEQITTSPATGASQITVDEINQGAVGDPTSAQQSVGGKDLCDPSVSDAVRRRHNVDCAALNMREQAGTTQQSGVTGTASDPLLQPRDDEARQEFQNLGLGDDVPATVILQR
ncbi:MAG: hypothetical protein AAGC81_17185 [Pseudomonadota bacterium]